MVTYEELIARGVPPQVASQTIYENLNKNGGSPRAIVRPRAVVQPEPKIVMAQEPEKGAKTAGRPLDPLSRQRTLAAVVLAQSYLDSRTKTLTEDQLMELLGAAYVEMGAEPVFPTRNSLQNALSALRRGQIKGYPKMRLEGPMWRLWDNERQLVVRIAPRNKSNDLARNVVDPTVIPAWVFA